MSTLKVANIKSKTGNSSMTVADNGTVTASGTLTVPGLTTTGTITHSETPKTTSRPYFNAYGVGTQAWSSTAAYATLALSGVFENVGSHYNTSTYKFTCPVAGAYFFWYSYTNSTNSSTGPQGYLVYTSGGSSSYRASAIQYNDYYDTSSNSAVITCAAAATVEVKLINLNDVSFTIDNTRCTFGGYLIG